RETLGQAVVNRRPALGIVRRSQRRRGLVEAIKPCRRRRPDRAAVIGHAVEASEKRRRGGELFPIERDASFGNHALDLAPRRDSGAREQFGDALRSAGILWFGGHSALALLA